MARGAALKRQGKIERLRGARDVMNRDGETKGAFRSTNNDRHEAPRAERAHHVGDRNGNRGDRNADRKNKLCDIELMLYAAACRNPTDTVRRRHAHIRAKMRGWLSRNRELSTVAQTWETGAVHSGREEWGQLRDPSRRFKENYAASAYLCDRHRFALAQSLDALLNTQSEFERRTRLDHLRDLLRCVADSRRRDAERKKRIAAARERERKSAAATAAARTIDIIVGGSDTEERGETAAAAATDESRYGTYRRARRIDVDVVVSETSPESDVAARSYEATSQTEPETGHVCDMSTAAATGALQRGTVGSSDVLLRNALGECRTCDWWCQSEN